MNHFFLPTTKGMVPKRVVDHFHASIFILLINILIILIIIKVYVIRFLRVNELISDALKW